MAKPRQKKPPTFAIGSKVRCTHAASRAYRTGDIYNVVQDPETLGAAIQARDGFFDLPCMVISTFETAAAGDKPLKIGAVQ